MSLLVAYLLLSLIALLWIAKDAETVYVFDVFGKSFRYVWFHSGERWTCMFTYGWRLLVLGAFVLVDVLLAYRIYASNPFGAGLGWQFIVLAVLLSGAFAPIPWIYIVRRLRWWSFVRASTLRLDQFVEGTMRNSDPALSLERADYEIDAPWTAWHPSNEEWKSSDLWQGLVPVVYLREEPHRAALFPVDWEAFLAWQEPEEYAQIGRELPIRGPQDASFRVESVEAVRRCPNWWIIRTEMCLGDDLATQNAT